MRECETLTKALQARDADLSGYGAAIVVEEVAAGIILVLEAERNLYRAALEEILRGVNADACSRVIAERALAPEGE